MARVLLVDDEDHIRRYYSEGLSEDGHVVSTVGTGERLMDHIRHLQPEVLVLDIRLVDYDGLELLEELRQSCHDLPVILCSAYDTYKYDPRAATAHAYVIKSFDLTELRTAIRRAVEAGTPAGVRHRGAG
ncbi:MAG: response regulator [Deltaproteobacteria bacterium]|nr:MAG: response regulator [Deltaproteobacteria bacterium]